MSITFTVTTTINGAAVGGDRYSASAPTREGALDALHAQHALATGGYDDIGDVQVITVADHCQEYPDLVGTVLRWDSNT